MKDYVFSDTIGKKYIPERCVRIINPNQIAAYLYAGVEILDLYASLNDDNRPIIVGVFDRKASYPAYEKWCNRTFDYGEKKDDWKEN